MKLHAIGYLVSIPLYLLFSSCDEPAPTDEATLIGKWQWLETTGGIDGVVITPETSGKTESLVFSNDSLRIYQNDTLAGSFHYSTELESTIFSEEPMTVLRIPSFSSEPEVIIIKVDTLRLADNFVDGMIKTYLKLKP
jgi:hypothetical protein